MCGRVRRSFAVVVAGRRRHVTSGTARTATTMMFTPAFLHPGALGLTFGRADGAVIIGICALETGVGGGEKFGAVDCIVMVGIGHAGHSATPFGTHATTAALTTFMAHSVATMAATAVVAILITVIDIRTSSGGAGGMGLCHLRMMRVPFGAAEAAVAVSVDGSEHFRVTTGHRGAAVLGGQAAIAVGVHPGKAGGGRRLCFGAGQVAVIIGVGGIGPITRLRERNAACGEGKDGGADGEFSDGLHESGLLRRRRNGG